MWLKVGGGGHLWPFTFPGFPSGWGWVSTHPCPAVFPVPLAGGRYLLGMQPQNGALCLQCLDLRDIGAKFCCLCGHRDAEAGKSQPLRCLSDLRPVPLQQSVGSCHLVPVSAVSLVSGRARA